MKENYKEKKTTGVNKNINDLFCEFVASKMLIAKLKKQCKEYKGLISKIHNYLDDDDFKEHFKSELDMLNVKMDIEKIINGGDENE